MAFASNNTIGYSIIQEAAWKYFPKNKGLANGIIYLGFFISSIISIFTHYIVNWDDIKPNLIIKSEYGSELYYDNEISMNVRQMLLMLLIVWSILLSCSYYFVRYPSESYLESIENISKTDKKFDRRKTIDIYYTNYKEALFSNRFIIIIAVNTIAFLMDFHLSFSFKRFTINYNYSDEFVTIVGSFLPAINSSFRILFSYLSDKIEPKFLLGIFLILQAICFGLTPILACNLISFVIILILYSITSACHVITFNFIFIQIFGLTMAGNLVTYLMGSSALSNILLFVIDYYFIPLVGYQLCYLSLMIIQILGSYYILNLKTDIIWRKRSMMKQSGINDPIENTYYKKSD